MSNHNYSQYSNKKNGDAAKSKTRQQKVNENMVINKDELEVSAEPATTPEVKMVVETVETVEVPKTVIGVVTDCTKLNVRTKPTLNGDVVCVINVNDKVTIDPVKSNRDWFCVTTAAGDKGYCMKKFVTAKL